MLNNVIMKLGLSSDFHNFLETIVSRHSCFRVLYIVLCKCNYIFCFVVWQRGGYGIVYQCQSSISVFYIAVSGVMFIFYKWNKHGLNNSRSVSMCAQF